MALAPGAAAADNGGPDDETRPMAPPAAFRLLLPLLLPILAAGCDMIVPPPPPPPPPVVQQPVPPPPPMALPRDHIDTTQAARLLANDPMALRFLDLRALAEDGLVSLDEANPRILANKGALLPLSEPQPPAAGLDRPVPPPDEMVARFRALDRRKGPGDAATRRAERAFLLDSLLPAEPRMREPLTPPDLVAARRLLTRVERLEDAGLITEPEQVEETRAVQALIASGRLPETVAPPPPPPKPRHKRVPRKARPYHGFLADVLPNPPGVDAPALAADAKGPAGVQLLSMSAAKYGAPAWTSLTQQFPQLVPLTYKVVKADLGELGVTYRLIAGPLDPAAATTLCAALKAKGQECAPTPFPP